MSPITAPITALLCLLLIACGDSHEAKKPQPAAATEESQVTAKAGERPSDPERPEIFALGDRDADRQTG